jgi:mannitol-1-phosphate 5-dehydrogenase
MATAVGANILGRIAKPIACGLVKRWESGNNIPLNIIICENLLDANHHLARLVKENLDASLHERFDESVGLVEASIGRMVPVMTPEMQENNPLRVCVEEYCELPVDKAAFKGDMPDLKNMVPFAPFDFYIRRKLFMHNMSHALTAYLGYMNDSKYIWEACGQPLIKLLALRALQESAAALSAEYDVPLGKLIGFSEDLLYRFGNKLLGDTVERVGKDPVRKLSENDRLVGAANLCIKKGISPVYISLGLAAGFLYNNGNDAGALEVQEYIKLNGIEEAMSKFGNLSPDSPAAILARMFYEMLKSGESLQKAAALAEKLKNIAYREGK